MDLPVLDMEVRSLLSAGNAGGATTSVLRALGREVYSFLATLHPKEHEAEEVFALVAEGVFRGLSDFEFQSSLRTWVYSIARKTSLRFRRDQGRRGKRLVALPVESDVFQVVVEVRTDTQKYLRTEVKTRLTALRNSLPEDERELLLLRVSRNLSWVELAQVLSSEGEVLEGEELKRAAARLRKRYQVVKNKLKEMAQEEGLLDEDEKH